MANLNTAITPAPQVSCLTGSGNLSLTYSGNVTVSLGSNPTGATLGGTTTVAASAGIATFSDLTLDRSGARFTLRASASNLRTASSAVFSIPTQLEFTTQPTSADADETMDPVVVTAQDSDGNTDTHYTGDVTVAIYTRDADGVLSGTLTVAAVAGVATFSDLSIDEDGTYTLIATGTECATAYPPAAQVSDEFTIGSLTLDIGPGTDINVYDEAVSAGIPVDEEISLTVNVVGDINNLIWDNRWISGSTFLLVNQSTIYGDGGDGGDGGDDNQPGIPSPGSPGNAGGNAIELNGNSIDIDNSSGNIFGGGGGGGGGGAGGDLEHDQYGGGGGGGGGAGNGAGGMGGTGAGGNNGVNGNSASGPIDSQTFTAGGIGGGTSGATGGFGRPYGQAGTSGVSSGSAGGSGGAAGKAINLSGGSANFLSGNNPTQVKGAVS